MTRLALLNIPEWTPRKLGNLELWYDATHIAGLSDGDAVTVWKDLANAGEPFYDLFTRANSTTELGNGWIAGSGDTFGILSNKAYSVTNAHDDLAYRESGLADGVMSCVVSGRFDASYSIPCLIFRMTDTDNYLMVNLDATTVYLYKKATTFTLLASGASVSVNDTDYTLDVIYTGNDITVKKNGTTVISHTLTGGDTAYAAYTKVGIRLSMSGTPASVAKWDQFIVCKLTDAFQTTAAAKPTYKTGIQNSRPVVRFDGTDDSLVLSTALLPSNGIMSILIVARITSEAVVGTMLSQYVAAQAGRFNWATNQSDAGVAAAGRFNPYTDGATDGAGSGGLPDDFAYTSPAVISFTNTGAAEGAKIFFNGTEQESYTLTAVYTGTNTGIGRDAAGTLNALDGDIAEILVSSAAWSDASRRRLENYVGKKYGTTITW